MRYVIKDLGFDACVDHKQGDLKAALAAACPRGIDVYFDNVGGAVLKAVLRLINQNARIPLCGTIADYNAHELSPGLNLRPLLVKRALIASIITDHGDRAAAFFEECAPWVRDGKLRYREDIVEGIEQAPQAFLGLFEERTSGSWCVSRRTPRGAKRATPREEVDYHQPKCP